MHMTKADSAQTPANNQECGGRDVCVARKMNNDAPADKAINRNTSKAEREGDEDDDEETEESLVARTLSIPEMLIEDNSLTEAEIPGTSDVNHS